MPATAFVSADEKTRALSALMASTDPHPPESPCYDDPVWADRHDDMLDTFECCYLCGEVA